MRRLLLVALVGAAVAACQSAWPAQRVVVQSGAEAGGMVGAMPGDSLLQGSYRWVSLDGRAAPQEFPRNSGIMLIYGTLDLRAGGSYAMRFTVQPANDTVRTSGNDGRFVVRGDSIQFVAVGNAGNAAGGAAAMAYRFAIRNTGELALIDTGGHVWLYARR